ncbi:MAG: DNA-binding protein [Lachnospiraceae bacterium]|nr:DNA-binding protein [Lachnospiraceae bacterium]
MEQKELQMTGNDIEAYNCIRTYIAQSGYSPSVREIGAMTGHKSTSTIISRLRRLESLGKIRRVAESPRTIVII